jgi:hypothetical protein
MISRKPTSRWTGSRGTAPLVDHLPKVTGIPSRRTSSVNHIGGAAKLTYYADILKYYRALAAATPRVKIETIGKSDEDRELVVVWVRREQHQGPAAESRQPAKLPTRADSARDPAAHRTTPSRTIT